MKEEVVQYNVRLNLSNPKHLEIFEKLNDLNLDIHKSKNNFIVESLYKNILSYKGEGISNSDKPIEYATKADLDDLERRITEIFMKEVISVMLFKLGQNQGESGNMEAYSNMTSGNTNKSEPVDPTLQSLAGIWTDAD